MNASVSVRSTAGTPSACATAATAAASTPLIGSSGWPLLGDFSKCVASGMSAGQAGLFCCAAMQPALVYALLAAGQGALANCGCQSSCENTAAPCYGLLALLKDASHEVLRLVVTVCTSPAMWSCTGRTSA